MEKVFASIITIGDELLIGQVIDTNSAWIAQELNKAGVTVKNRVAVGDVWEDIWAALDAESKKAIIEILGCNTIESNNILHLLFNQIPQKGIMLEANWRKLGFSTFICIVVPVVGFFVFGNYIEKSILEYANYTILYAIFIGLILFFG